MPKISIIVPINKCEEYIERCVANLMQQPLQDIEFIFENDCTPDNSLEILKNVVKRYPLRKHQIKIIEHKKNRGITYSRKNGVLHASGDYIGWCDSDDWIEVDMFEKMYKATDNGNIDIVICDYKEHWSQKEKRIIIFPKYNTPQEYIENCHRSRCPSVLWNQIIKRDLYTKHIDNIVPVNYGEDTFILWHVYFYAKSTNHIPETLYNYNRYNIKSLTQNIDTTYEAWKKQEENYKRITSLYYSNNGKKKFHKAINYMKFKSKYLYKAAFKNQRDFFYTFRESSRDILHFPNMNFWEKWKTYISNNIYIIFKITSK